MYLAIPTIVNRGGAQEIIQISLADDELNRLKESATILKKHLNECNV